MVLGEPTLQILPDAHQHLHLVGSAQERLAREVAAGVERHAAGRRLLDVSCGRGGAAAVFADTGFDVAGVDLVPYNVVRAGERADGGFVVGDATALPFADGAFDVCVSVDAPLYFPDEGGFFREARRVIGDHGVVAVSDLVVPDGLGADARRELRAFADAWDMAGVASTSEYGEHLAGNGFDVVEVRSVTSNSIVRFGRWALRYLLLDCTGIQRPLLISSASTRTTSRGRSRRPVRPSTTWSTCCCTPPCADRDRRPGRATSGFPGRSLRGSPRVATARLVLPGEGIARRALSRRRRRRTLRVPS